MSFLATFTDELLAALGVPPVDVNAAAVRAAERARASQAALAHLPEHQPHVKFGAERTTVAPARPLAPTTALHPSHHLGPADEQRLARRRALRHITTAGAAGADPAGSDPQVLRDLVIAGMATVTGGRVHPTQAGRQAAAAV